jgi:hypothetical protein
MNTWATSFQRAQLSFQMFGKYLCSVEVVLFMKISQTGGVSSGMLAFTALLKSSIRRDSRVPILSVTLWISHSVLVDGKSIVMVIIYYQLRAYDYP